jgi:hypothetical protein
VIVHVIMVLVDLVKLKRWLGVTAEIMISKSLVDGTRTRNCTLQKWWMGWKSIGREGIIVEMLVINSLIVEYIHARR